MGGYQVSHSVGYNPGFAASGPCQEQERTLNVLHGLALAGVQTFEEIHGKQHFSMGRQATKGDGLSYGFSL